MTAIVAIDPVSCPAFANHFAISEAGLRKHMVADQKVVNAVAVRDEQCKGDKQILSVRVDSATKAAEINENWARYAPLGIVVSFILGVAGGILAAVAVGR